MKSETNIHFDCKSPGADPEYHLLQSIHRSNYVQKSACR